MRKEQKQYERQFKLEAVEYFLSQDKSAKKIAEHFGVCAKTFYSWVREYKENGVNSFRGKGIVKASNSDLKTYIDSHASELVFINLRGKAVDRAHLNQA